MSEESFEEEGGGYLVDEIFAVEPVGGGVALLAALVEKFVGFAGGEAFVEQMVGEGGVLGEEGRGEEFSFGGLGAGGAVGMEGKAYDEGVDLLFADETAYRLQVGVETGAVEREERLRGETEAVGNG